MVAVRCAASANSIGACAAPVGAGSANPGSASSDPRQFGAAPDRLYFVATTPATGPFFATAEGDGSGASMIPALGAPAQPETQNQTQGAQ